ncbi:M24 family metallopeptidase [bacterium]|nr:M24 family metallopeptidase [bacterium]
MPAPTELLQERISRVQEMLKNDQNGNPMLVTGNANVGWLTGIPADFQKDACLLIRPDKAYFVTDGRYTNRVPEIPGMEAYIWGQEHVHLYPELKNITDGAKHLVCDTTGIAIDMYHALPAMLELESISAPSGLLDRLRMIKGDLEMKLIREAVDIAIGTFNYMVNDWLPKHKDTATDIDFRDELLAEGARRGSEGASFDPLVAMDADADTPHPEMDRPGKPLKGEHVMLVDWGFIYKGVCTDMTRMIIIGYTELPPVFQGMRMLQEKWFDMVAAQLLPGLPASEGGAAYQIGVKAAGIDTRFHGAGHGTGGAYVHELPKVSELPDGLDDYGIPFGQAIVLEPGMIVTNEPGMYEKGVGAYRTENMVLITEDGHEALDRALPMRPFFVV